MVEKTEVLRTCVHVGECISRVWQVQFLGLRLDATAYIPTV